MRRSTSSRRPSHKTIAEHGPDSVAFYVSGQLLTEDYYVANKLMKGFIGSANIDTNSRLCMSSSVAGHKRAFGADTVPGCYEDLELADLVVLVGSNLAWCHPVLYQRIAAREAGAAGRCPSSSSIRAAPRQRTSPICTCRCAPDGDVALFTGLLAWLAKDEALDRTFIAAHTKGFDDALAAARKSTLDKIADADRPRSGRRLRAFYDLFARDGQRPSRSISQGVNQSSAGTDKVNAIINCHLLDRAHRQAGHGPFLGHRPAQRHGRARSRRPRQHARRAYGHRKCQSIARGSGASGAAPTHRGKSPASRRSNCSGPSHDGRDQGAVDHGHQSGRQPARRRLCRARR